MDEREKTYRVPLPGKFPELEEAILIWLYDHPQQSAGTETFARLFNPNLKLYEPSEELREALKKTQFAIETLIEQGLVRGETFFDDMVLFSVLRLTPEGMRAAIRQKRRPTELLHSVPQPDRDKEGSDKAE